MLRVAGALPPQWSSFQWLRRKMASIGAAIGIGIKQSYYSSISSSSLRQNYLNSLIFRRFRPAFPPPTCMSDSPERVKLSKEEKDRRFQAELMPVLDPLYNFAYRLTLDEDDANDLVQETYLKAYRFFEYFEPGTNAKAWLFRILKNSFINDFRKKSKQPAKVDYSEIEGYYNPDDVEAEGEIGASSSDMRQQSTRDLIGDEVASALNSLPVDFRTVIILCDLEGFTYEEMAKVLDIPIGTVRSRLHRARNFLKDKLERYAQSMGYGNDTIDDETELTGLDNN